MDDFTFNHLHEWATDHVYDHELFDFMGYANTAINDDPTLVDVGWPSIYRTFRDVEQVKRNERREHMYQGYQRSVIDVCPGCGRVFEGRICIIMGLIQYHKGRCKPYKEFNRITDLSVASNG